MKRTILLFFLTVATVTMMWAQNPMQTMMQQLQNNPDYYCSSAKNASEAKAAYISMQNLLSKINSESNSSDIITQPDIESHVQKLTLNENGLTEVFLYIKKVDIGKKADPSPLTPKPSPLTPGNVPAAVTFHFTPESQVPCDRTMTEQTISKLLTAINKAYAAGSAIDLTGINMTEDCQTALNRGWKHKPYYCTDASNVKRCLQSSENINIRDIPVYSREDEEHARNISIAFNKQGQIECVRFAAETASYDKIMRDGGVEITDKTDLARRTSILSFVENYRQYYVNMDIDKIEQIFADDAIIITGSVIRTATKLKGDNGKVIFNNNVTYKKQNRDEYIASLKKVFANNQYINVLFNDIRVCNDPDKPFIYGVTLKQSWDSKSKRGGSYHDDGYVFLLWDFQNPEQPKIHVRTWQPVEGITKPSQVFGLNSFQY